MKQRILLCAFAVFTLSTFAQDSTFQLKDYEYRTPGFRALSLNFQLNGALSNAESENYGKSHNRNVEFSVSQLQYYRTSSTEKRLHVSSIHLSPYFTASSSKNDNTFSKHNYLQTSASWFRNDKFYKSNKWFLEAGNELHANFHQGRNKDTTTRASFNNHELQNTVVVGFGKGRVENVQDAQMAMYILADLEDQGLLNAPVTPQIAKEFAQLITSINNRRIFDSRRRRIFELTQIDAFLRSQGLLDQSDIRHFTTINDNWALAYNPGRLAGANWYVRVRPGVQFKNSRHHQQAHNIKRETSTTNHSFSVAPIIGYEKHVPINLKWQRDMGASFSFKKDWENRESKYHLNNQTFVQDTSIKNTQMSFYTFYGVGYYPNNRTQLTANLEVEATRWSYEKAKHLNITLVKPALQLSADYFISYQTRLYALYYLTYQHHFKKDDRAYLLNANQLNTHISVGLSHILF